MAASASPIDISSSSAPSGSPRTSGASSSALASTFKRLIAEWSSRSRATADQSAECWDKQVQANLTATGPLTNEDIDDVVTYLLEKLNDHSEELNRLSCSKEALEKELKSRNRVMLKQASKIKLSYGNRAFAIVEVYFEKMLRLCMRDLELRHCGEMKGDMEDELAIAGTTIEQFDNDLEADIWWRTRNLTSAPQLDGQLAGQLQPPSSLIILRTNSVKKTEAEIVQHMRNKLHTICLQLDALHDKISTLQARQSTDRANLDRFCQLKQKDLAILMPLCGDFFDARLGAMVLKPRLDRLSTQIDRTRRTYGSTMRDLSLVSNYIHQFGPREEGAKASASPTTA